jgi:hypothetical protein
MKLVMENMKCHLCNSKTTAVPHPPHTIEDSQQQKHTTKQQQEEAKIKTLQQVGRCLQDF